ncbi:hypothetical protein [Haliovirga abyssi]|uniref:DUF3943 domain-containing protein n=1 Tax=Haliovirga abyssi TaxID=2996794 RepID=A0AAU9DNC3_9FUSO|nr:hypothetical protein [Haliovirga abyssi]BDU51567.1 hypothetical protein HLVA_21360 [Haliovirga abyssi]
MKKIVFLFLIFSNLIFAEELVLKEMQIIPPKLQVRENISNVEHIFIIKNRKGKYYIEVFYKKGKSIYKKTIPVEKKIVSEIFLNKEYSDNLSYETEKDKNIIVYGTTLYSASTAFLLIIDTNREKVAFATSAVAGWGSYIYLNKLADRGTFYKRDFINMSLAGLSTTIELYDILRGTYGELNKERVKFMIGTGYAAYLYTKKISDKYKINRTAFSIGTEWMFISRFQNSFLVNEKQLSERNYYRINAVVNPIVFYSGLQYGMKYRLSMGAYGILDNYSLSLRNILLEIPVDARVKAGISSIGAVTPYILGKNIEEKIKFRKNDWFLAKASQGLGWLTGLAITGLFEDKMEEGQARTFLNVSTSLGVIGATYYTTKLFENRNEKIGSEKLDLSDYIDINPIGILSAMNKLEGNWPIFTIHF